MNKTCPNVSQHCGGCPLLTTPYPQQLAQKQARLQTLLGRFAPVEAVRGMDEPWHYRNKAIASFAMTSIFICLLVTQKVTFENAVAAFVAMVGVFTCKAVGLAGPAILVGAVLGVVAAMLVSQVRRGRVAEAAALDAQVESAQAGEANAADARARSCQDVDLPCCNPADVNAAPRNSAQAGESAQEGGEGR